MNVLLIEDEPHLVAVIQKGLREEGLNVSAAYDGETGLDLLSNGGFDLVILDIILPRVNGWEVCRRIRSVLNLNIPVLILSALNQTEHVVKGLNAGADDYLSKPFKISELMARMQAVSRRYQGAAARQNLLSFSDLKINLDTKQVWRGDQIIRVTAKEFRLLAYFLQNPNKVLSRFEILESVWETDFEPSTNVVDVYVNYLRRKLETDSSKRLIQTVFGMGYVLKEEDENQE